MAAPTLSATTLPKFLCCRAEPCLRGEHECGERKTGKDRRVCPFTTGSTALSGDASCYQYKLSFEDFPLIFLSFFQVFKSRVIQSGFPGLCMVDDVRTELNCNERDDDHSYNLHFVPLSKFQLCRRDSLRDLQGLRCACGRLLPLRNAKHLQGRHLRTVCAE